LPILEFLPSLCQALQIIASLVALIQQRLAR